MVGVDVSVGEIVLDNVILGVTVGVEVFVCVGVGVIVNESVLQEGDCAEPKIPVPTFKVCTNVGAKLDKFMLYMSAPFTFSSDI